MHQALCLVYYDIPKSLNTVLISMHCIMCKGQFIISQSLLGFKGTDYLQMPDECMYNCNLVYEWHTLSLGHLLQNPDRH